MAKDDAMGSVVKWVLILGGGYLAYEYFIAPMLAAPAATPATPTTPVTTTTATVPVSSTNPTPIAPVTVTPPSTTSPAHSSSGALSALATKVLIAAGTPTTLTADQWNYYWSQVSGVHQTANLFPSGNRDAPLTFTQYLAARSAQNLGVSGLGQLMRFGRRPPVGRNYVRSGTPMRRIS